MENAMNPNTPLTPVTLPNGVTMLAPAAVAAVHNPQPAPAPSVPSIATSAMLVELSISQWTGIKKDKKASQDVEAQNHADRGVTNVSKKLLGDCAELKAVHDFTSNVRTGIHYDLTLPWSNSGLRLLPTSKFFDYQNQMTALQTEWWKLVEAFLAAYEWEAAAAQAKLGSLFARDEYPTTEKLRGKFNFSINYMPMPEAGDWRVDVGRDAQEMLAAHYQKFYAEQTQASVMATWTVAAKALAAMSERLADPTENDRATKTGSKVFRDSLVENVMDAIDKLEAFNLTGDPTMRQMRMRLQHIMDGVTPDALREDRMFRLETKRAVDEAIKALPSLDL